MTGFNCTVLGATSDLKKTCIYKIVNSRFDKYGHRQLSWKTQYVEFFRRNIFDFMYD